MTNPISMPATVARFALVKKCSNQLETLCALKRISYTNVAVPKAGLVNQLIGLRGRSGRTIQNHLQWLLARGFIGDDGTCYFLRSWSTYEAQCGREIGWKGWNLRIRLYSGTSLKDLAFAYTVDSIKHSLNLSTKEREATVHEGGVSVSQLMGETGLGRATIVALKQRARRNKVLSYRKRYALVKWGTSNFLEIAKAHKEEHGLHCVVRKVGGRKGIWIRKSDRFYVEIEYAGKKPNYVAGATSTSLIQYLKAA